MVTYRLKTTSIKRNYSLKMLDKNPRYLERGIREAINVRAHKPVTETGGYNLSK